mmetsp:Transcript_7275/g.15814  ORF Transcript_7275/g.15814 Transcript_7275/m.15814 type:complete len:282 (-) Transcript_7275:748-1593(-)
MAHRPGVLSELPRAQPVDVLDALHGVAVHHVPAELLVAVHRESLLERELEPIPARDPVPRPVVKVFVSDHRLDAFVVAVGGGLGVGQNIGGVEHVQALVLHGPHVEIVHRHHIVHVQVIFQPEGVLVPLHALLQALHGVIQFPHVIGLAEHLQVHLPSRRDRGVRRLDRSQVAGDDAEEVGGLGMGVGPRGVVSSVVEGAFLHLVAVAEEDGVEGGVGLDAHAREDRHVVGPVGVEGDAPEAHGLALRAVHGARLVQARELGVRLRLDFHLGGEFGGFVAQ